jgi:hypothetical protein
MEVDFSRIEDFFKTRTSGITDPGALGTNAVASISGTMSMSVKGPERRQNQQTNLDPHISLPIDWQFIHAGTHEY